MPTAPGTVSAGLLSTFDVGLPTTGTAATHEDLMDLVTILDSFQTPFFSTAPKVRAYDPIHSWAVDSLAATATAGLAEGIDFEGDTLTAPSRQSNVTQIFTRHVLVSDRERESRVAGIRDMYQYQTMKGFKEIIRNYESRVFTNSTASATGAEATTAPLMKGLRGFAISTASSASGGVATADLVVMAQTLFQNGAEPDSLWFSPDSKRQFTAATLATTFNARNIAADDHRIVANIDVFETPFNQLLAVITDRFILTTTSSAVGAYFMGDRSMAKVAVFRPPQHKPMGKSGDHTRGIVLLEATLQLDHPSSWYAMTGVTNG